MEAGLRAGVVLLVEADAVGPAVAVVQVVAGAEEAVAVEEIAAVEVVAAADVEEEEEDAEEGEGEDVVVSVLRLYSVTLPDLFSTQAVVELVWIELYHRIS